MITLLLGFNALMITIGVIALILLYRTPAEPEPPPAPALGWLEQHIRRRLVVHTTDGQSLEGLLSRVVPDGLVLSTARYLDSDPPTDLQGEIFLPRPRVSFAQFLHPRREASE